MTVMTGHHDDQTDGTFHHYKELELARIVDNSYDVRMWSDAQHDTYIIHQSISSYTGKKDRQVIRKITLHWRGEVSSRLQR